MGTRILAAFACAALVACGGGAGDGSSTGSGSSSGSTGSARASGSTSGGGTGGTGATFSGDVAFQPSDAVSSCGNDGGNPSVWDLGFFDTSRCRGDTTSPPMQVLFFFIDMGDGGGPVGPGTYDVVPPPAYGKALAQVGSSASAFNPYATSGSLTLTAVEPCGSVARGSFDLSFAVDGGAPHALSGTFDTTQPMCAP